MLIFFIPRFKRHPAGYTRKNNYMEVKNFTNQTADTWKTNNKGEKTWKKQ